MLRGAAIATLLPQAATAHCTLPSVSRASGVHRWTGEAAQATTARVRVQMPRMLNQGCLSGRAEAHSWMPRNELVEEAGASSHRQIREGLRDFEEGITGYQATA